MIRKISLLVLLLTIVGLVSAQAKIINQFSTSPYPVTKTNANVTSYLPTSRNPEDTIKYDGNNYTGIGLTSGGTFWGAVRFTTAYGCTLKSVIFYQHQPVSTSGMIYIHDAGTTTTPGAKLDSASYPVATGWVRVDFTVPRYFASGTNFWLDVICTNAAGTNPFGIDSGPSVSPARSYVSTDGATWTSLPAVGLNYNWNLRAIGTYVRLANDVGVDAIVYPTNAHRVNSPMVPIARVKNYGNVTQTNFAVICSIMGPGGVFRYTNTQTIASLASNTTVNVNFASWTPTILESETVKMRTNLSGDQNPNNDRRTRAVMINNFLLEEGFNGTWPPPGWTCPPHWAQTPGGTNPPCTPYEGAYMAWYYSYIVPPGTQERLITPAINVGSTVMQCSVAFYMYHDQDYPTDHDSIAVEISPDEVNWTFIGGVCRVDGGPANQWTRHVFYMGNLTDSIYVGFKAISAFGDNIFIDYVTVKGGTPVPPPQHDVGMYAIRSPSTVVHINVPITPIGVVKNYGAAAQSFAVVCSIMDGGPMSYAYTYVVSNLASGDTARVTFPNYTPVSEVDTVIMRTLLSNDSNPANDRMMRICIFYQYYQDFEATDGGFKADPSTGAWTWGPPSAGPSSAYSGLKCWGTGTYSPSADWNLNSCRYIALADSPQIGFMHWYQIESGWDGGNVKYSINDTNWILLYPFIDPYNGMIHDINPSFQDESCWTGTSAGNSWHQAAVIIPVDSGQIFWFRWHFHSDPSVQYAGWYVDDVVGSGCQPYAGIEEVNTNNIFITALNSPRPNPVINGLAHISFTISAPTNASLKIYDVSGRAIKTLVNTKLNRGVYNYTWNGTDDNHHAVAEGIYFYTLLTDNTNYTKKLIFTR
jgi:hypothetical protein